VEISNRHRIETNPQKESGIATFSERALFFDLIRTTRNQLKSLNFNGEVTNLKGCHALLEAARRYLDYGLGHYFNPFDH
jgi:hypothetical protein